jgi:hypothetical protein
VVGLLFEGQSKAAGASCTVLVWIVALLASDWGAVAGTCVKPSSAAAKREKSCR